MNSPKRILISAGHNDKDQGCAYQGTTEGKIVTELRDAVFDKLLSESERHVVRDGDKGQNLPLSLAIKAAKDVEIAVELHCNAGGGTGIECLSTYSKRHLAKELAKAVHKATGLKLRGDNGWKPSNAGQHHRLGFCDAGGVIVELFFLDNASDYEAFKKNKSSVINNIAEVLKKY